MLNTKTHSTEHPNSYYFASRAYNEEYPALSGDVKADVCVIGGGFSGVNTALELAERGLSVVLLEAYRVGWGASGRNGGQMIRGLGEDVGQFKNKIGQDGVDAIDLMGLEAVEIVKARVNQYSIDCDLKMGYADVAHKKRNMDDLHKDKEWLESVNYQYETRIVEKKDMSEIVGSDNYIGGMVDMGSGHLHPLNLNLGEAVAASEKGVQIFEQSRVIDIEYGTQNIIKTESGRVTADQLVICGNAYVAGLNNKLESQVLPAGSYVIATEQLSDEQCARILPQDMALCDQRVDLDYYRLSADNRLLFGGLCNYSGRDPRSIVATLKPHLDLVFPYLKDVKIDYQWGGMIGIGANRMPQIGRMKPNVYYAQAYSGHGVNATHMAAKVIAEKINGESDRIELFEKISHMRFPGGRTFRSPLLAVGMLYHRAKDLF